MKAGFFEADVTPPLGGVMTGYPGRNEPSEGVDDPLYLRIVALEDAQGQRAALVTLDLCKLPRDLTWRTKSWAARQLGLESPALILNSSHTHSAPPVFAQLCYPHWPVDDEYVCTVEQAIRDGLQMALESMAPTQVRFGLHQAHFGVNRRIPQPDQGGRVKMGPNPDGYYDPDLPVFAFYRADEQTPVAVLYSYACHPTSKSGLNISGDWPGQVAQGLKEQFGADLLPMFAQGAGASIMPRCRYADGAEQYHQYWRQVAADLADFVRSDAMQPIEISLHAQEKQVLLPYDRSKFLPEAELLELADPQDSPLPDRYRPANRSIVRLWARLMLEQMRTGTMPEGYVMHMTRWQLADGLQLLAMSGEVTAEVGRRVKDLQPDMQTVLLGYCSYTDAYIPTAEMLPQEGHEAFGSLYFHERPAPFVPELDDIIAREANNWA